MKLDYTIVYARSFDMDSAFNGLRKKVAETMQDGYVLQGGVSLAVSKSGLFYVTQTMIREREENGSAAD